MSMHCGKIFNDSINKFKSAPTKQTNIKLRIETIGGNLYITNASQKL